jgi:hypothetical protein
MVQASYDIAAIAADAEKYMTQTPEELEYNFKLAWASAREGASLPHRGADSFWQNTCRRLAKEIVKNETTGSVAIVSAATTVVEWLQTSSINLTSVEFPISLFVALVTKSAMDELKARNAKNKPKNVGKDKKPPK